MFDNKVVGAIIVAAGKSKRMRGIDKIFTPLDSQPVLGRVISVFEQSPSVDRVALVLAEDSIATGKVLASQYKWKKLAAICAGGARRQDSVRCGLGNIGECGWIVIHDGARPLLTSELIENGLAAAKETGAAACAVPVKDTIKLTNDNGYVVETPPRSRLWSVQTPQVFRIDVIRQAYDLFGVEVSDDAQLVETSGFKVKLYHGDADNIKITGPSDLHLAEIILKGRKE